MSWGFASVVSAWGAGWAGAVGEVASEVGAAGGVAGGAGAAGWAGGAGGVAGGAGVALPGAAVGSGVMFSGLGFEGSGSGVGSVLGVPGLFDSPVLAAYVLVVACVLGLVVGSFVNCWAWRATHGESILAGRSHCTSCGHELGGRDLVPLVSWLLARGRCRYCGARVPARYPATEAVCGVVFAAIVAVYGVSLEALELLMFAGILLFLSLTDLDERVIPNGCIVAALGVRVAFLAAAVWMGGLQLADVGFYVASAFGMGVALLVVVLAADRVLGRESMGGGDLKLYFVAGLYFGWMQGILLVVVSCVFGIVVGLVSAGSGAGGAGDVRVGGGAGGAGGVGGAGGGRRAFGQAFPFGPSIAAACVVVMLVGEPAVGAYLSLL